MKLAQGFAWSLLIHGLLFFGGAGYLAYKTAHAGAVMEIDLVHSSLLLRPRPAAGPARVVPPEPWYLAAGRKAQAAASAVRTPPPVEPPEEQTAAPEETASGEPGETFLPVAAASRIPEWVDGLITEEDYPATARNQGREGKVVATVSIDAEGRVKDVQIAAGSYPEFDQLVLERLRSARFRPARDQNGDPIAVRMSLPIVFELR